MTANIAAVQEVDQLLKKAMKLLHSSHASSAAELRHMLDEAIQQRHGPEKMLSSTLTARLVEEELNFPGRAVTPPPAAQQITSDEIINLTHSPAKTISDSSDDGDGGLSGAAAGGGGGGVAIINTAEVDDVNLKEFGDLNCCVCGEMMFTATNRLIECSICCSLYHQECHKPHITDEDIAEGHEHNWQCESCCNKPSTSKSALILDEPVSLVSKTKSSVASSRSSTSSNSSSPFYKPENSTSTTGNSSGSSSKHGHKSSSSSSKSTHKEERSSSKSGSTVLIPAMPNTSDKHSSSTKSRRASMHSSKSSSKHHESSSSSKRRSNK